MNIKRHIKRLTENPYHILSVLAYRGFFNWLSDEKYLKLLYKGRFGKSPDLDNPKTFNEKLQWLKLHDRKPVYTQMVDKYETKKYVAERIGEEYVIPTLGVWDSFDEIDFDSLPDQFVLKCTHDSGGLVICKDKSKLDKEKARKKIEKALKRNFYLASREWPYKDIFRRIIAETYMEDASGGLIDYKVHCFGGEPKFILVCGDRFSGKGLTEDFMTPQWERMPVKRPGIKLSETLMEKPPELEEILELSRKLSENIPFVRTDFYIINHKVYFSELTFFPAAGFKPFEPEHWDETFGSWIPLPGK